MGCGVGRLLSGCRNSPEFLPPVSRLHREGDASAHVTCGRNFIGTVQAATALWLGFCGSTTANSYASVMVPLVAESLLLDGAVSESRLTVIGERGHIVISSDDGASWRQANVPTRVLLTAVHMHDALVGWAVGHDAIILRTSDGGESWAIVHEAPEEQLPLLDVWFRDQYRGFAVGAYGYALATDDGGDTWSRVAISGDDYHLNALIPATGQEAGSTRLYIAAEAGVIYRSEDGGDSWKELESPYAGSWFGGLALNKEEVMLTGLRGNLFRSGDSGNTWQRISTGTQATLTSAVLLSSGAIMVTGLEGVVLISHDGGRSVVSRNLPTREGISTALPLADGGVLLVGEFGVVRFSQDD